MAENVIVNKQKLDNIVDSVNQKAGSSNQMTLDQIPPAINALNNIKNHSELEGRDSPNQHTMGAITGLNDALGKKLETTALSSAIDTALAQAKASGEFDGKDGATGPQGPAGLQGLRGETGSRGPEGKAGPKGDPGMGFQIFKIYKSIDLMNKDYATSSTVPVGGFVLVDTGNTGDADHGKLYVKTDSKFNFIVDMSGANGIQGPRGEKGLTGDAGPQGATGSVGPQGPRGLQGNPGEKGATGDRGPRGYDFNYNWNGTSLGIKSSNENSYKYVNLKGDKGEPGQTGGTGPAGANGKSVTHSWSGSKLTLTSASGTTTTDLRGPQGNPGQDGGIGPQGPAGAAGKTPVKGEDYFTAEDINQVAGEAAKKVSKTSLGLDKVENTADSAKRVSYAETAGSAKASDVSDWAKQPKKPTYTITPSINSQKYLVLNIN